MLSYLPRRTRLTQTALDQLKPALSGPKQKVAKRTKKQRPVQRFERNFVSHPLSSPAPGGKETVWKSGLFPLR